MLRNEDMEMVVVPACGRIIHYAPPGEANFLWENPELSRPAAKRKPGRGKSATSWLNHGGDKAWPWPQSRWAQAIGRDWPPPSELERQPHDLNVISRCAVSLTSAPLPDFGVRVARKSRSRCAAIAPRSAPRSIQSTARHRPILRHGQRGRSRRSRLRVGSRSGSIPTPIYPAATSR